MRGWSDEWGHSSPIPPLLDTPENPSMSPKSELSKKVRVEVVAQDKHDKSKTVIPLTKAIDHLSRFTDKYTPQKARVLILLGQTVETDTYFFFRRFSDN